MLKSVIKNDDSRNKRLYAKSESGNSSYKKKANKVHLAKPLLEPQTDKNDDYLCVFKL